MISLITPKHRGNTVSDNDYCSGITLFVPVQLVSEPKQGDRIQPSILRFFCPSQSVTNGGMCVDCVPLRMHYDETEPSNTNPIFLMIQIVLALVAPKSHLPECLVLNPLCNPATRPS